MKIFDSETEKRIRGAVKLGEPYVLDELTKEICGNDEDLLREFSNIVADEYRRRLTAMPRTEMRKLYCRYYKEEGDANKDWLLGEIIEGIEAEQN